MPRLPDVQGLPLAEMTRMVVTAALIERGDRYLVTRRQKGVHLEGYWEFPGGKCDPGETYRACLERELREELGVAVEVGREVFSTSHTYPDRIVELHFLRCELLGEPSPRLGQEMHWVPREELDALTFPPADAELIRVLTGPGCDERR